MKITWNWLADFVELEQTPAAVAERLAMAGLEVEAMQEHGRELRSVRVAEIVSLRPHPQAERLHICEVRLGAESPLTVVCGAPNARPGLRVAYAAPQTTLPNGQRIAAEQIRGVQSVGMLCSESELGIGPDASGILILPPDAALGEALPTVLGLEDIVLDVAITPNRGDCLSVLGLAREIAALTGQRLKRPRASVAESRDDVTEIVSIQISDDELCGRYVGRVIANVSIQPSPLWLQYRLRLVGMRPINNVVDVTNYVLLERGQPLHAFDLDRLPRAEIDVRRAGADRIFKTLDGQQRELSSDDLLITAGGTPVALAGIMGGENSEVSDATRRILLESAWFHPAAIRRTSRRLGLRSESSYRFERCVDIEGVAAAADRAAGLIARLAGGSVASGRIDVYPGAHSPAPIALRLKRMEDLLGMTLPRADVIAKLKGLGMNVSPATRATITVVPPSYRADLQREIDLIEEVVRVIGYEHVPASLPKLALAGEGLTPEEQDLRTLRRTMTALGFHEAVAPSFTSPQLNRLLPGWESGRSAVTILNPMSQDDSEMRLSLASSLARVAQHNLAQSNGEIAVFTIGKVFWRDQEFREAMHVGAVLCPGFARAGIGTRDLRADFADAKGVVESVLQCFRIADAQWQRLTDAPSFHPGKTAAVLLGEQRVGVIGVVHPALVESLGLANPCWLFELDLVATLQYCPPRAVFQELPRFPAVRRDVAVLVEDRFAAGEVVRFVRGWMAGAALIEEVQVFDEYAGAPISPGKKSVAYSIAYRAADRTLTDTEVNELHAQLIQALVQNLGVQLR